MHQMCGSSVRESSIKLAGDGKRRRNNGLDNAESSAESLRKCGFACTKRSGKQQHVAAVHQSGDTPAKILHGFASGSLNHVFTHQLPYRPL